MEKVDHDCIVIGGSANGAQAAFTASNLGIDVAIIEDHPNIGYPEHCSGLFSYWGLEKLDAMPPKEIIFNHNIFGSRLISPNGKILSVRKKRRHALVCDRAKFDQFVIQKAINAGTKIYQPFKAVSANRKNNIVHVTIKSAEETVNLSCKMLISAEGVRASIAKQMGLSGPPKSKFVNAAQFYMKNLNDLDPQMVEIYQFQKNARNFFAWVIPMDENSAKIGLGTSHKYASKEMEKMIFDHPVLRNRCEGAEITRKTAGRIPTSGPVKKTYSDNFLLTGDVAGQTKQTTGGGVILGGIAAQISGQVVAEAVAENNYSASFLKTYQKRWKKEMSKNFRFMSIVRKYVNQLKDTEINDFFDLLDKKGILKDIEEYGDIDEQSVIIKRFMKTLRLYPFYLKTSPRLIRSLF